jgi:hypothetical protein
MKQGMARDLVGFSPVRSEQVLCRLRLVVDTLCKNRLSIEQACERSGNRINLLINELCIPTVLFPVGWTADEGPFISKKLAWRID